MPYKNPENKRKWEQEHCDQRNARRRQRRFEMQSVPIVPKRVPDPVPVTETGTGWSILIGIGVLVVMVGMTLLGVKASLPYSVAQ